MRVQRSFQDDPEVRIVLDTSVIINLVASGFASQILHAIPNSFYVVDTVCRELNEGREHGWPHADLMEPLCSKGQIDILRLGNQGLSIFTNLTIGPSSETLDDGEAATLACAVEISGCAMIDERKAIRIAGKQFPSVRLSSSVELFSHPEVERVLSPSDKSRALYNALIFAHMRILPQHIPWVLRCIGPERAMQCPSIPTSIRNAIKCKQLSI